MNCNQVADESGAVRRTSFRIPSTGIILNIQLNDVSVRENPKRAGRRSGPLQDREYFIELSVGRLDGLLVRRVCGKARNVTNSITTATNDALHVALASMAVSFRLRLSSAALHEWIYRLSWMSDKKHLARQDVKTCTDGRTYRLLAGVQSVLQVAANIQHQR